MPLPKGRKSNPPEATPPTAEPPDVVGFPPERLSEPEWVTKKIRIRVGFGSDNDAPPRVSGYNPVKEGDKWITVKAEVIGTVAVHEGETERSRRKWAVTHSLCGLLITHLDTREDATKVAEYLWRNYRAALEVEDHDRSARMIPAHVKGWLRKCREWGRWVEPDFLEENE